MAVKCRKCGYEMSNMKAMAKVAARVLIPATATVTSGLTSWISSFVAEGCNRVGVKCPECESGNRWDEA